MIFLVLIAIIIKEVVSQTSYEYLQTQKFDLVPWAFRDAFSEFYLPNQDTYLLQFKNNVKMVNEHLPNFQIQNFDKTDADFWFGRQVSLIKFYDVDVTRLIKSYQYPDKIIESYFNQPAFNSIIWINSTTAIVGAQFNKAFYLGFYKSNTDFIDLRPLPSLTQKTFRSTVLLSENDVLLVCDDYLWVLHIGNFSSIYSLSLKGQSIKQQCIKTFSQKSSDVTLVQYIMVKVGANIKKYCRKIDYKEDGSIASKSFFELQVEFLDLSFDCGYGFGDSDRIWIMNSSSGVILRSSIIQDFYIGKRQTKLQLNSIGVKGSSGLFISNGNLQKLDYRDLSFSIINKNLTNTTNQKKAWITKNNHTIAFAGSTVVFTYSIEGKPYIFNVMDCQLIQQNILFYISKYAPTKLVAYDVTNNSKITDVNLDINPDSQIQLQLVRQPGKNYCLLEIYQKGPLVLHEVWYFNSEKNALEKQTSYNHTANKNRTIITSQTTFEIEQDITDDGAILRFWNLENRDVYDLVVPRYKWLKTTEKAFAIYLNDDSKECLIYRFAIDTDKKAITVNNKPVKVKLEQMSSSIPQNHIFLLEDLRANAQPDNYLIYFYDESNSYYYNTLDPIIGTHRLLYFPFSSQQAQNLLIKPQFRQNAFYFSLPNSSFVQVRVSYLDYISITQSQKNLTQLFTKCSSIQMQLLKQKDVKLIGFTCQAKQKDILIIYKQSSIMTGNIRDNEKLMILDKSIKDYALSENSDIAILNIRQGNEYLHFYRKPEMVTISVTKNFMCLSPNGYYLVYKNSNNQGIYLMDVMTEKNVKIQESSTSSYSCSVDDSGDWIVFYRANSNKILRIYYRFTLLKQIYLKDQILLAQFFEEKLLLRTSNDIFFYDDLVKGTTTYLLKNNNQSRFDVDINQNYITYRLDNDSNYYAHVCELGVCYPKFEQYSYYASRKVHADGRVVSFYSNTGEFLASEKRLKSCGDGKYIKNGECWDCVNGCNRCEALTGACLDCEYGKGYLIAFWCLLGFVVIILLGLFKYGRSRKIPDKKQEQKSLMSHSRMDQQLEETVPLQKYRRLQTQFSALKVVKTKLQQKLGQKIQISGIRGQLKQQDRSMGSGIDDWTAPERN